jgi:hypothetical protein
VLNLDLHTKSTPVGGRLGGQYFLSSDRDANRTLPITGEQFLIAPFTLNPAASLPLSAGGPWLIARTKRETPCPTRGVIGAVIIWYQVHVCVTPRQTMRSRPIAVCASNRCGGCWRQLTVLLSSACSKHTFSKAIGGCLRLSCMSGWIVIWKTCGLRE